MNERGLRAFVIELDQIYQKEIRSKEQSLRTVSHENLETRQGEIKGLESAREKLKKHAEDFLTPQELREENL